MIEIQLPPDLAEDDLSLILRGGYSTRRRQQGERLRWYLKRFELEVAVIGDVLHVPDDTPQQILDGWQARIDYWSTKATEPPEDRHTRAGEIAQLLVGIDDRPFDNLTAQERNALIKAVLVDMRVLRPNGTVNLFERDEQGQIEPNRSPLRRLAGWLRELERRR